MKKALLLGIISMIWLTLFMDSCIAGTTTSDARINIEPYLNKTCVSSTQLQIHAEYTQCFNETACETYNFTQTHECAFGCDSVNQDCDVPDYKTNLYIVGGIVALIVIIAVVVKR